MQTINEIAQEVQDALRAAEAAGQKAVDHPALDTAQRKQAQALLLRLMAVHKGVEKLADQIPDVSANFGGK